MDQIAMNIRNQRSILVLLVLALGLGISRELPSQVQQYPSWASELAFSLSGPEFHPEFQQADTYICSHIKDWVSITKHGKWEVRSHPLHGQIAFRKDGQRIGALNTGLKYVFHVDSSAGPAVRGSQVDRLIISGQTAAGVCKVLSFALVDTTDLTTAPFVDLTGPILGGDLIVKAFQVGSFLYTVNATDQEIQRYFDSDSDGIPDAPDPIAGAKIGKAPGAVIPLVSRIFLHTNGEHRLGQSKMDNFELCISAVTGTLSLGLRENVLASKPHFYGHKAVGGMDNVRLRYVSKLPVTVWIEKGGVRISDIGLINPGVVALGVRVPGTLVAGTTIELVTSDGKRSGPLVVAPNAPVLFGRTPFYVQKSSGKAVFRGRNLGLGTYSIVDFQGNQVPVQSINIIKNKKLVVDISTLEAPKRYWIKVKQGTTVIAHRAFMTK